ncbi:hypothetical protein [Bradyrhizobium sp. AZCC 2230]|uniref:hypothetical protein n=1 Tax=Bradyrhizobium sp. AZCC 2230 TaxID=3117021 RepID=UPI002FEE96CE
MFEGVCVTHRQPVDACKFNLQDYKAISAESALVTTVIVNHRRASPSDSSLERPTKFDLKINLRIARTPGIERPPILIACTDKAIK